MKFATFLIAACAMMVLANAYSATPDDNPAPVKSCDWNMVRDEIGEVSGVSWEDEAAICREMSASLGSPPPIGLLRILCKVTFIMRAAGSRDTNKEIAFQVMNVVEARGQKTTTQIHETFETLTKIFNGTNGRVTPKDVNINLRALGQRARKLNQDGMFGLASVILEDKKVGRQ